MKDKEFIEWLLYNCGTTWRSDKKDIFNIKYFWFLNNDSKNSWDGDEDDKLRLFTSEEIYEYYIKYEKEKTKEVTKKVIEADEKDGLYEEQNKTLTLDAMTPKTKYEFLIGMIEACMPNDEDVVYAEKLLDSLFEDLGIKF